MGTVSGGSGLIHSAKQDNDFKLQPGLWREEKLKVAPGKLLIFSCPKCGMRSPIEGKVESWEYKCLDNRCKFQDFVTLDGWEPSVAVENGGKAAESIGA